MKTKKVSFIDGEAARQKGRSMAFTQRRSSFRQARRKPRGGFRVPRANTLASSYAPDRPVRPTPGARHTKACCHAVPAIAGTVRFRAVRQLRNREHCDAC
jgi:hypothetical protein